MRFTPRVHDILIYPRRQALFPESLLQPRYSRCRVLFDVVTVQLSFVFTISLFPFRSSIAFFILITSTAYASDPRYPAFPSSPSFVAYVLDTYILFFFSMYRLAAVLSLRLPCTIVVMYHRHHAPSSLLLIICILSLFIIVRRCHLKSNHRRRATTTIQIMSRLSGVRPGEGSTVTNVVIAT